MPVYTGIEILQMIRASEKWKEVPVIMFTTSTAEAHVSKCFELGATYYLPKIADYEETLEAVKFVINQEWDGVIPDRKRFVYANKKGHIVPKDFK